MPCPPHRCPSLALTQARWRQLRSCAGALESIIWAYRTRAAPFEPDGLHPNANDDKAERTLHLELVEWRQGLAAGADLNSTTLRRRFPEWVFKHDQRPPKADSMWQRWMRWMVVMRKHVCCGTRSWTDAVQAKAQAKAHQEDENLKTPAYCAPLPHLQPLRPRCRAEHPAAALNLAQHAILNPFKSWLQAPPTLSFPIQLTTDIFSAQRRPRLQNVRPGVILRDHVHVHVHLHALHITMRAYLMLQYMHMLQYREWFAYGHDTSSPCVRKYMY